MIQQDIMHPLSVNPSKVTGVPHVIILLLLVQIGVEGQSHGIALNGNGSAGQPPSMAVQPQSISAVACILSKTFQIKPAPSLASHACFSKAGDDDGQ